MKGLLSVRAITAGVVAAVAGGALAVGVAAHTSHSPSSVVVSAGIDYFYTRRRGSRRRPPR
jgi:hypothetical protein